MSKNSIKGEVRLAILQRVCSNYNVNVYRKLSAFNDYHVKLFIGYDLPRSKVKNTLDMCELNYAKLQTVFLKLGASAFPIHRGLIASLKQFKPDIILCEGESNILNYLQAIFYRWCNRKVGLIHWSLGGLPGESFKSIDMRLKLKYILQKNFDCFVVYSSFAKERLIYMGHHSEKIFVATNVSDTERHLEAANQLMINAKEARKKLNLPDKFTALYVGTIDVNKRLEQLLLVAKNMDHNLYNFIVVGNGPMIDSLKSMACSLKLSNIYFLGHIKEDISLYYRASNVLVLPGRGGMVISEAMCYGLPVIVFQADGTEYDLVRNGQTGIRLSTGDSEEFKRAIEFFQKNPLQSERYGRKAQELIRDQFSTDHMVTQIRNAISFVYNNKNKKNLLL